MSLGKEGEFDVLHQDPSLRREMFQREGSRVMRLTALALFASFALVVLPQLLTPAQLEPNWQLGLINTMLGVAILPPVPGLTESLVIPYLWR